VHEEGGEELFVLSRVSVPFFVYSRVKVYFRCLSAAPVIRVQVT